MHPLVVQRPALSPHQPVGHPPAPADVLSSDLPEATAQLGLLDVDDLAAMALSVAVLAHQLAGEPLRNPDQVAQGLNSPATPFRAQKFPLANCLSISFSSSASARASCGVSSPSPAG